MGREGREAVAREGAERGLVEAFEQLAPARAVLPHLARVEFLEQFGDTHVELLEPADEFTLCDGAKT
ncbi:MAG: hypothetical protein H6713_41965 [Myxococcales bacterium]|nr:hypothetical protein [Myxococcales bacterium]